MMFARVLAVGTCVLFFFTAAMAGLVHLLGEGFATAAGLFLLLAYLPLEATKALLGPVAWRTKAEK